jgi:hypothetical protein
MPADFTADIIFFAAADFAHHDAIGAAAILQTRAPARLLRDAPSR